MKLAVLALLLATSSARADMMNDEALHAQVDADVASGSAHPYDHLGFSLGALVPIFGTTRLDRAMFGDVRPTAVVVDWILGGLLPLGLAIAAVAVEDRRAAFGWTAAGLYAATRIAILVVGNLHISEYNRYLHVRVGTVGSTPALVASWSF